MDKIQKINQNVNNKDLLTINARQNLQIDTIQFEQIHNLEDTSKYLEKCRKNAKTDSYRFQKLFFEKQFIKLYRQLIDNIENDPEMNIKREFELTPTQYKDHCNFLFRKIISYFNFTSEDHLNNPRLISHLYKLAAMIDASVSTKFVVHYGLYCKTLANLGTQKHFKMLERGLNLQDLGCFMMTELAHGSNVQALLTTAHYIHEERSFIINTVNELGMKFWIGNLGRTANIGVCFANLIIDKKSYGIHVFIIPLRNIKGEILSGINIGDCGPKMGMNGIDNGWVIFRKVKIPYDNLLDKFSQIDQNGKFITKEQNTDKRFAMQLAALGGGRIIVGEASSGAVIMNSLMVFRYLSIRKQFGTKKYQEQTVINYPIVQHRLFKIISICSMNYIFAQELMKKWQQVDVTDMKNDQVKVIHALGSYIKKEGSEFAIKNLIELRELCGGHGYSQYSKIPSSMADNNIHMTWEGANSVLIQQTAKFLLQMFGNYVKDDKIKLKEFEFIRDFDNDENFDNILQKFCNIVDNFDIDNDHINILFDGLHLCQKIKIHKSMQCVLEKFSIKFQKLKDLFQSFNGTLPNSLLDAVDFFGEFKVYELVQSLLYEKQKQTNKYNQEIRVFKNFLFIYLVQKFKIKFWYLQNMISFDIVKKLESIQESLYDSMLDDMIIFSDAILMSDEIVKSTIGAKNGQVYKNILNELRKDPRNQITKSNWNEILRIRKLI